MKNQLNIITVVLLIAWVIGFIGYGIGGLMHILIVLAFVALILRLEDPIFLPKVKI